MNEDFITLHTKFIRERVYIMKKLKEAIKELNKDKYWHSDKCSIDFSIYKTIKYF